MVTHTTHYQEALQQIRRILQALLALYQPDQESAQDWATLTVRDLQVKLDGVEMRLSSSARVTPALTGSLVQSFRHYLDGHWDDYREIPIPNPTKYSTREQLHKELAQVLHQVGQIHDQLDD